MIRRVFSVLALIALTLVGSVAATQYLARTFAYAPELGAPALSIGGTRLYPPYAWSTWQKQWGRYAKRDFANAMALAFGGAILGLVVAARARGVAEPQPTGAYGSARWATEKELRKARLLGDSGIVLAQTAQAQIVPRANGNGYRLRRASELIRHDGPEHAMMFAPTGSGKGVSVVIPTLLTWTGSAIVYDIKRENWEMTAGWRSLFSHCLRFEPSEPHSVRFNPLLEIRAWPYDVRDAQNIAEILVNPDALTEEQRDHWKLTGHAFLVAVILHVLYAEADKSLAGVLHALTNPDRDLHGLLDAMLHTRHLPAGVHPTVAGGARAMLNRSDNERSGVVSTAESFLALYRDPIIAANTSVSDFALSDLMCAEHPVTLYLLVPPSDADRTKPVMRLLLNFFGRRLTEHLHHIDGPAPAGAGQGNAPPKVEPARHPVIAWFLRIFRTAARAVRLLAPLRPGLRKKRHRLLYLIDEFPSLGRMPFFEVQLAFLRGYGIKCLLIAQSLNQLDKAYGQNHSLLDNCHIRLTFAANDERTAKRISDLAGTTSLIKKQLSESERGGFFTPPQRSYSYQEFGRPLKTPNEILSLPETEAILFVGNQHPYLAKKVIYYDDPRFRGRVFDAATGHNEAPNSPAAQRAQLPPPYAAPHWLHLAPAPRRAPPQVPERRPPSHALDAPATPERPVAAPAHPRQVNAKPAIAAAAASEARLATGTTDVSQADADLNMKFFGELLQVDLARPDAPASQLGADTQGPP